MRGYARTAATAATLVGSLLGLLGGGDVTSMVAATSQAAEITCTVPAKTLTFECDDGCNEFSPCWLNSTAAKSTTTCNYQCYNIYGTKNPTTFIFLVPYGEWESEQERAGLVNAVADQGATQDTADYISKSNDLLDTIDTLQLPAKTTAVSIVGGSYVNSRTVKGKAANVAFATDLLVSEPQVTDIYFANLNLGSQVNKLAAMLPTSTVNLTFTNGLLTTFPTGISKFTSLSKLTLSYNYITKVNASMGLNQISTLAINGNNLISFEAVFSNLASLVLSSNNLTEFPSVLLQYPRLETLYLDNNNLSEVLSVHAVASVKTLYLGSNRIDRFEAFFPSLTWIDLRSNNLTEIPPILFNHTAMKAINLAGNLFENVSITNAQADFLVALDSFSFSSDSLNKNCYVYQQREVHGLKFCISDANLGISSATDGGGSSSVGVIVGVIAGVLVLVLAIAFLWFRTRKSKSTNPQNASSQGTGSNLTTSNGTGVSSVWNDADLLSVKVNAADIQDIKQIGKGAYGDVWLVRYCNKQMLASKRLRKSEVNRQRTQDFIGEIKIISKLEHPKIVQFIGVAWTIEADLQALLEYMEGGDLRLYLENPRTSRAWTHEKLQIAIDVIEALVYVHSFSPPLVHRDLKSRNVLLTTNLEAKLTDFGVSRYRSEDNTMTAGVGTGKWLAPEVISGSNDYGPAADIFSFGVVLSELDTHALPYEDTRGVNGNKLVDVALLQLISTGQVTPSFTASCPDRIVELATRCFALNPADRPTATEVAYALRKIKKSMYTLV